MVCKMEHRCWFVLEVERTLVDAGELQWDGLPEVQLLSAGHFDERVALGIDFAA